MFTYYYKLRQLLDTYIHNRTLSSNKFIIGIKINTYLCSSAIYTKIRPIVLTPFGMIH